MPRSYIGPRFDQAKVHDAMRVGVVSCRPETRLSDVARMMVGYDIHSVIVAEIGAQDAPWGIVTSIDLAKVAGQLDELTAADVATTDLVTIGSDQSLERAARLMAEHGIAHVVAVQPETGRPAGMISAKAIAAAVAFGA